MTPPTDPTPRLRELLAAATPGPWIVRVLPNGEKFVQGPRGDRPYAPEILGDEDYERKPEDAELIAALRNSAESLLDALAELRRRNDELRQTCEDRGRAMESAEAEAGRLRDERDAALEENRAMRRSRTEANMERAKLCRRAESAEARGFAAGLEAAVGEVPHHHDDPACKRCGGRRRISRPSRTITGDALRGDDMEVVPCPACGGGA